MKTILYALLVILSVAIVVVILMQPSKTDGLNGLLTGNTDTFFSKNKSRTREVVLARITIVLAVCFAAVVLALGKIQ